VGQRRNLYEEEPVEIDTAGGNTYVPAYDNTNTYQPKEDTTYTPSYEQPEKK
jgi:hypothetical protein